VLEQLFFPPESSPHPTLLARRHLASAVGHPKSYALATLPRSITRDDVSRFLAIIDRKTNVGRRDYAMLLLLVTYGLRAREVAAMALDHFDWRRERLRVPAGSVPTFFATRQLSISSRPASRST
jgi:integrase